MEQPTKALTDDGILAPIYRRLLPAPLRERCRALVPARWRGELRRALPYEQDVTRAARFWLSPGARRSQLQELDRCGTLDEIFDVVEATLGHQQIREEILQLVDHARGLRPARACEIGTAQGGTNLILTRGLPTLSLMIAVDRRIRNRWQRRHFTRRSQELVHIEGSSRERSTIDAVELSLGPHMLDLLFIDGAHSSGGVKQYFLSFRHLVRDGGIIAFHDIMRSHAGGTQESEWHGATRGEAGLLWRRLKEIYPSREFVKDRDQDGSGIGVLEYSSRVALPRDL